MIYLPMEIWTKDFVFIHLERTYFDIPLFEERFLQVLSTGDPLFALQIIDNMRASFLRKFSDLFSLTATLFSEFEYQKRIGHL